MPFVVNEQTGSKIFSNPKLVRRMPPTRSNTPAINSMGQITLWHAFHVILTISSEILAKSHKRARTGISDYHKSACKYTSVQRIQTKFSQYIRLNTSFILFIKPWHDLQ